LLRTKQHDNYGEIERVGERTSFRKTGIKEKSDPSLFA
jgi:hypothetical protein